MGKHMLKYHVALPVAVFAVMVLVGVPVAGAARVGIAAGCVVMVLMMITGGVHRGHRDPTHRPRRHEAATPRR
jgi:hypothetical protein